MCKKAPYESHHGCQITLLPELALLPRGSKADRQAARLTGLPDDHRALEPPDPFPNSEVKRCIADGSVGSPHVRVGHRQALNTKEGYPKGGLFLYWELLGQWPVGAMVV